MGTNSGTRLENQEPVDKYLAQFGGSFVRLEQAISVIELKSTALRPSDQTSIEELGLARLERLLATTGETVLGMVVTAGFLKSPASDEAELDLETDVAPSTTDEREQILRAIKIRRGQSSFRRGLIKRYGSRCLVTGCKLEALIEAAHIAPYRNASHNDLTNGLLLRADIHTLFDLYLMQIDPITLTITFDESVCHAGYSAYNGKQLQSRHKTAPSAACLKARAELLSRLDRARPAQFSEVITSR